MWQCKFYNVERWYCDDNLKLNSLYKFLSNNLHNIYEKNIIMLPKLQIASDEVLFFSALYVCVVYSFFFSILDVTPEFVSFQNQDHWPRIGGLGFVDILLPI